MTTEKPAFGSFPHDGTPECLCNECAMVRLDAAGIECPSHVAPGYFEAITKGFNHAGLAEAIEKGKAEAKRLEDVQRVDPADLRKPMTI